MLIDSINCFLHELWHPRESFQQIRLALNFITVL
jgi:hypothetical protein